MADVAAPTTLHKFEELPAELRVLIWQEAAGKDIARTIDVEIRCANPVYVRPLASRIPITAPDHERGGSRAHVRYDWSCTCVAGPDGFGLADNSNLQHVNNEARNEYLLLNPHFISLENGRRIHFKSTRDTIYMDARSIYTLHMYTWVQDHLLPRPNFMANLRGFGDILSLEIGAPRVNYAGLTIGNGFFAGDAILTGIIRPITRRNTPAGTLDFQTAWLAANSRAGVSADFRGLRLILDRQDLHSSQTKIVIRHFSRQAWQRSPPRGVMEDILNFFT